MGNWIRRVPMLWLLLPLVAIIIGVQHFRPNLLFPPDKTPLPLDSLRWWGVVLDTDPVRRRASFRYDASVLPHRQHTLLYLAIDSTQVPPLRGDTLFVRTRWREGGMIADFDYGTYLRRRGIAAVGYASSRCWSVASPCKTLFRDTYALRAHLIRRLQKAGIEGTPLSIIAAMSLGYREEMDRSVQQHFQRSGAAHVLAVSGLHTGIIYGILLALLTLFGRFKPLYNQRLKQTLLSITIIALMIGYAAMTGNSPSVVRSVVMIGLIEVAHCMHRQSYSLNTVAAAAFLILCIRPQDLFSVSFQLSFAAVIGILVIEPPLRKLIPINGFGTKRYALLTSIRGLITVSIAAFIATMPITIYYFGQYSRVFILTNLLVIPLAFLIVITAMIFFAAGWIPYIGIVPTLCLKWLACGMDFFTARMENLPHAVVTASIDRPTVIVLYGIITAFTYLLIRLTR